MRQPGPSDLLARTAHAVAAARHADEALDSILAAVRDRLGASGAALLRAEGARLVPVRSDGLVAEARAMDEATFSRATGGGYPLVLAGRVEGVLLVTGVAPERLADEETTLVPLLDLAAVALRNARLQRENDAALAEARRAETRYRSLFQGVADAILVATPAQAIVDVNAAAEELLGYARAELLGRRLAELIAHEPA